MVTSRDELRGKIQTVQGLIEPDTLGPTLMHEHLLWDITPRSILGQEIGPEITLDNHWKYHYGEMSHPRKYELHDVSIAIEEVAMMQAEGGRAIVELTCGGLKPDPAGLQQIQGATGVPVIMGCGHYLNDFQDPRNHDRTVEDFAEEMVSQVLEGAWGTDIRSGIIGEIGCSAPWTELERRVMRAAIIAQSATGAAINVHPGRHVDQPQEVAEFAKAAGADLTRMVISHIDRTIFDSERLIRLADTGVTVELDLFGQENAYYPLNEAVDMPNDAQRLRDLRTLIDHGHLERIVISHDICYVTRLTRYGGHGYGHIFRNVVPMMRRHGFSEDEIDAILVRNPRRLLTIV